MVLKQRPDGAEADVADMRSEPSSNEPAEIVDRFARLRLAKSEQRCAARGRGIGVQMLLPTRIGGGADSFERGNVRSEEHTSELQSLMRISYAVFCLTKKQIIIQ